LDVREDLVVKLAPEHFAAENFATIWGAIVDLHRVGRRVDVVSVHGRLGKRAEELGGLRFLEDVARAPHNPFCAPEYAAIISNKWKLRQLIAACQKVAVEAGGDIGDIGEFIADAERDILRAVDVGAEDAATPTMRDVLAGVFRDLQSEDADPGVKTGLADLDRLMGPMLAGQLIIIAAHTGIGKTSLALLVALNVATAPVVIGRTTVRQGVLVFSHEMTAAELAQRALLSRARVNSAKVTRKNTIQDDEWKALAEEAQAVALDNL
jgi:replicative DNA helicase